MHRVTHALIFLLSITSIHALPFADSKASSNEDVILGRTALDCSAWYLTQGDPNKLLAQTLKPPCRVPASFPAVLRDGWSTDPECDAAKQPKTCQYHKGAHGCYRHAFKERGPGAQACYDKNGQFIDDVWKGAGTVDAQTPLGDGVQQAAHFVADVVPFYSCCKITFIYNPLCNLYYEKRPAGQCENKPAI